MSDHAEGELRGLKRWRVARHLSACARCQAVFRTLLATIESLRALGRSEPHASPQLAEVVIERIRASEQRQPPS